MMKTAHPRQGQNVARLVRACFNRPSRGCRLLQSDVRAVFVIVGQIITPKPPEMLLVQWDDVIEYFAARTPDPALGDSVGQSCQLHRIATSRVLALRSPILTIR